MYDLPFGDVPEDEGPGPVSGGTLEKILARGMLHCGVRANRAGFAQKSNSTGALQGMDIDFCHGLAASIFGGEAAQVKFIEVLGDGNEAKVNGYAMLASGGIDVLAGTIWTLQGDITTGLSFSTPYFYSPFPDQADSAWDENLCLATRQNDPQWSSFVNWVVDGTIHAEENGITQRLSNSMPVINVFGGNFSRFFRDALHAVGNYGEIYERNLSPLLRRSGRNTINSVSNPGPQHYVVPGFF